jgi:hypothetical protein
MSASRSACPGTGRQRVSLALAANPSVFDRLLLLVKLALALLWLWSFASFHPTGYTTLGFSFPFLSSFCHIPSACVQMAFGKNKLRSLLESNSLSSIKCFFWTLDKELLCWVSNKKKTLGKKKHSTKGFYLASVFLHSVKSFFTACLSGDEVQVQRLVGINIVMCW